MNVRSPRLNERLVVGDDDANVSHRLPPTGASPRPVGSSMDSWRSSLVSWNGIRMRATQPPVGQIRECERLPVAIESFEARLRRRQANAFVGGFALREPGTVVADLDDQPVAVASRTNRDAPSPRVRCDAVADGVLDQRLQDEVGHECVERHRLHVVGDLESVVKAGALDLQVQREDLELAAEAHLGSRCARQRQPKQVAEACDDARGGGRDLRE